MTIDLQEVKRIAQLARLRLDARESSALTEELARILDYVRQLDALDTSDVDPLAHPLDLADATESDEPRPSLDREDVLRNAPQHDGRCYVVPAVL